MINQRKDHQMSHNPRLVPEFLSRYPGVDGYTLICICEEINRRMGASAGVQGILEQALLLDHAGKYLASVCLSQQKLDKTQLNILKRFPSVH